MRLTDYGKFFIFLPMTEKPKVQPRRTRGDDVAFDEPSPPPKPVVWIGSSKADISELPDPVKASFGHRLGEVQRGRVPLDTKPLPQFGSGVFELRERFDGYAYRVMYVVALRKAIYVLHAFMKKSTSGIRLPKPDADLIELRLKRAQSLDAED
jgi:phage-related protein